MRGERSVSCAGRRIFGKGFVRVSGGYKTRFCRLGGIGRGRLRDKL